MFEELLSRGGLSIDRLRSLAEIASAQTIAKAANRNSNRQSTYSRQLKQLEGFFGEELATRNGKSLRLNERGLRLSEIARRMLHDLRDFDTEVRNQPFVVTFGAGDNLLQWLVLPNIGDVQSRVPKTIVNMRNCRTADIVQGLNDLSLDVGLIRETGLKRQLKSTRLFTLTYSLFVPRKLLKKHNADSRWVLENLPLALQSSGDEVQQALVDEAAHAKFRLNLAISCESFPQVFRAVLSGCYAGVLPRLAAADLPDAEFIRMPALLPKAQDRVICLAWSPRLIDTRPQMGNVITCLADILKKKAA
jgi:DNA-binding transcriptional LysR family regulator